MSTKVEKNRQRFFRLILQLGRFKEEKFLAEFGRNRRPEDLIIDSEESPRACLRRLRDSEMLEFDKGYYVVPSRL